jgi:integrase
VTGTAPKGATRGKPRKGMVETVPLRDGSASIRGRFRHRRERYRVVFGRDVEGWTEQRGSQELKNIYAHLDAGISIEEILARYEPAPLPAISEYRPGVLYDVFASRWLERRRIGEIGEAPLADNTYDDYLSRLRKHILPFFGHMPVAQITDVECKAFRAELFADRDRLMKLIEAGGKPTHKNGRPRKALSLRSIQMQVGLHAQILDEAIEEKIRSDNPARSKRMRVRVPKPNRTFLEVDQLVALLDAAGELEAAPMSNKRAKLTAPEAQEIRARLARGEIQYAVRKEYGMSSGAMSMLANGKTYRGDNGRVGWRALCATLGYAGPRISEALDLKEKDVRLHDPKASRLWIADSKTQKGIRYVEVTPQLRDVLLAHRAEKIRRGYPVEPEAPFFCTRKGTRWDDGNVRERVLAAAVVLASKRLVEGGLPPLPDVVPHTMRRTYISIMLLATKFDVKFVQSQVGHEDSKLTVDVYQQLLDRSKREHGVAFDALVSDAKRTLYGAQNGEYGPQYGPPSDFGPKSEFCSPAEFGSDTGEMGDGRGGFRTCDLSRVKRAAIVRWAADFPAYAWIIACIEPFLLLRTLRPVPSHCGGGFQ